MRAALRAARVDAVVLPAVKRHDQDVVVVARRIGREPGADRAVAVLLTVVSADASRLWAALDAPVNAPPTFALRDVDFSHALFGRFVSTAMTTPAATSGATPLVDASDGADWVWGTAAVAVGVVAVGAAVVAGALLLSPQPVPERKLGVVFSL